MASGNILRQLVKAGAVGDATAFRQVSEAIIQEERQKQHHLLANDLEQILYGGGHRQASAATRGLRERISMDQERGLPLLSLRESGRGLEDVVLTEENQQVIDDILEQHHRADVLRSYGLPPADKLLFCGPPGCGKPLTAEVVAAELSLPLAFIRLDSVVSSYLGETAANLRKVFDFIDSTPMVALFDESTERDFVYVTTASLTHGQLAQLSEEVGPERTLLVLCTAFRASADAYPNLTVRKIPNQVLSRCEWGHDDYSLRVENLPEASPSPGQMSILEDET
ncbi:AAA family ATPase [Acidithiobacillus sulfuriphilus]|uniref:AAA family ATPase n=1 Tax=Acidithiobacillus sulfuriphilus TaxID=1867749 RepID=UPI003F637363